MSGRRMALTAHLVARVHRLVEDSGPLPGLVYHTEEDYDAAVPGDACLAAARRGPSGCSPTVR